MQIPWYVLAIGAAVVWGLHYPLVEYALRRVSLVSVMLLTVLPILLLVPFYAGTLGRDWNSFRALDNPARLTILLIALTSLAGTGLLFLSIRGRNATLASLIEISYPAFVALFAWAIFREWQLNSGVLFGAVLVFAGTAMIILNSR
ncbi:MAG: DMT family transporter [Gammaproteobacteria bacterium]|nr:DMT family transporter [Gammaproteobacteria bacterium]